MPKKKKTKKTKKVKKVKKVKLLNKTKTNINVIDKKSSTPSPDEKNIIIASLAISMVFQ